MKRNRVLCSSLAGWIELHLAHAEVRHLDGKSALDLAQIVALFRSGECGSDSSCGSAAGAAHAMHKILGNFGQIEVDYVCDVGHVEAARGDIRGDEHAVPTLREVAESLVALRLRAVAVNLDRCMSGAG